MKKFLAGLVVSVFSLVAVAAYAGDFADLKKQVMDAREQLVERPDQERGRPAEEGSRYR